TVLRFLYLELTFCEALFLFMKGGLKMLNKLVLSYLTVLVLFVSGYAYSQEIDNGMQSTRATVPEHVLFVHSSGFINPYGMTTDAARADHISTQYVMVRNGRSEVAYIFNRKYVRPSDTDVEETYLEPMVPVITSKQSIGVAPNGFKYFTRKSNIPIRDFRADMWKSNYYLAQYYKSGSNDDARYIQTYEAAGEDDQ